MFLHLAQDQVEEDGTCHVPLYSFTHLELFEAAIKLRCVARASHLHVRIALLTGRCLLLSSRYNHDPTIRKRFGSTIFSLGRAAPTLVAEQV